MSSKIIHGYARGMINKGNTTVGGSAGESEFSALPEGSGLQKRKREGSAERWNDISKIMVVFH